MRTKQLYAGDEPIYPETDAHIIPVADTYKLTGGSETTMQGIINAIADRVVNRLLEKSELPDWAKAANKPSYTAAEIGADTSGSAVQALADAKTYADSTYMQATGYTDAAIARLINGAPTTLDTLKEIADAMAENESVVDALADAIGTKASETEAQAHYGNTTVHITASERNAWNNKVDRTVGKSLSTNDYTTTEKNKLAGIADNANNYSLPLASATARGGVKTGYAANGRNYPVQLDNEQMYVNVPWTDTNTTPDYSNMVDLSGYLVYNTVKTYKPPRAGIISISFYATEGTNNAISIEHHELTRYMTVSPQYGVVNTSCDFIVDTSNVNIKKLSDKIQLRHAKYIPLK